ncbi:MAG: hypothetical protein ACKVY0_09120 [Prosthecobacter sp.]|uniref:hypothetical protein n=1 Tax=Prosthecobacter sp. TaxID=1965333 RepID=UPI003901AEA3
MKAIVNLSSEEMLKVRYNQPRVSLEELRLQEAQHRQASEEFFKVAKNAISKPGRVKVVAG